MAVRKIVVTRQDCQRLESMLASDFTQALCNKGNLKNLRGELALARIVEPDKVPPDVVTMGSTVRLLDLDCDELETFTLVYPDEANIAEGKLSVLAPIGTAILGYRVGDMVCWKVPSGESRTRIEEVLFQPERDQPAENPTSLTT
ncbi:Regulator of nucleoside diphosphate kinase [Rosistilla ulvae]|uniref:Regulator of nucleoside diphosphate kinase n=1 Tax=Rosistilla ulvae TaxID=1930277 RepID=A0A517M5R2_9BACT|nr:nucleoside diphosphate kinase regulator [Rosistilla ulvae]QDS90208.1 Regulator of nucleoside diphosphate kinase [Rosistilla ulvae]